MDSKRFVGPDAGRVGAKFDKTGADAGTAKGSVPDLLEIFPDEARSIDRDINGQAPDAGRPSVTLDWPGSIQWMYFHNQNFAFGWTRKNIQVSVYRTLSSVDPARGRSRYNSCESLICRLKYDHRAQSEFASVPEQYDAALDLIEKFNSRVQRSRFKVTRLVVSEDLKTRYRLYNGSGLILANDYDFSESSRKDEFDLDTVAHESAHAVFEDYLSAAKAPPTGNVPLQREYFALHWCDIHRALSGTSDVPGATEKFNPARPPSLAASDAGELKAAGIVMLHDTLWAARPAGHPWGGPDESYSSALAGWTRNKALVKAIFAHYASADPKLPTLIDRVVALLEFSGKSGTPTPLIDPSSVDALRAIHRVEEEADDKGWGWQFALNPKADKEPKLNVTDVLPKCVDILKSEGLKPYGG